MDAIIKNTEPDFLTLLHEHLESIDIMAYTYYFESAIKIPDNFPEEAKQHLKHLLYEMIDETAKKYIKGQLEHGGLLPNQTPLELINSAIDENIDQAVYLRTARANLIKNQQDQQENGR